MELTEMICKRISRLAMAIHEGWSPRRSPWMAIRRGTPKGFGNSLEMSWKLSFRVSVTKSWSEFRKTKPKKCETPHSMNCVKWAVFLTILILLPISAQSKDPSPLEVFNNPKGFPPREVYQMAHKAFYDGNIEGARLLALRIFLDGYRSQNLLDLLGAIEIKANRPVLAGEWLRKALCLNIKDSNAQKLLARLPAAPRPIPINPEQLREHFNAVTKVVPKLLARLSYSQLHFESVFDAIQRGQFYLALALSEEYEKRYPGADGQALTALCAYHLCRIQDSLQICKKGLSQSPYHPLLLTVQAFLNDTNPETSATSRPRALYDLDRWDEAIQAANQLSELNPRSAEGFLVKARIALDGLNIPEASSNLAEVEKRDSDHPALHLLQVELFSKLNKPEEAGNSLERAFRRGYHLPSVNLEAALIAASQGKIDDGKTILDDAENSQPFLDRDAYPMFVLLALMVDQLPKARKALDVWGNRMKVNSTLCFMEAFYNQKAGDSQKTLEWIRKGFTLNPNHAAFLSTLSTVAANLGDTALSNEINSRLSKTKSESSPEIPLPSVGKELPSESFSSPKRNVQFGKIRLQIPDGIQPNVVEKIQKTLSSCLNRLEGLLGFQSKQVEIKLVDPSVLPEKICHYDFQNDCLSVSSFLCDSSNVLTLLSRNYPEIGSDEKNLLSETWPTHMLTHELSHYLVCQEVKNAFKSFSKTGWMHEGLAEILGGEPEVIKRRLQFAHQLISSGTAQLLIPADINRIFSESNQRFSSKEEVALAESYLMAAFLIKRESNFAAGIGKFLKIIDSVSGGKTLDQSLQKIFNISQGEFDSGWKEAAYWSLRQGVPYEW
ncbi:hypothetical protein HYY75_02855 [bacterium]|nr:hypothetical protein [bacterium]